jgi:PIN domain nuclease of toxin-antitoxin system
VRILLDTHVLFWWLEGGGRLRAKCRRLLADARNELLWSAASTWELAIKTTIGKVRLAEGLEAFLGRAMAQQSLTPLPVLHTHAARVVSLPLHHRDPFDRLLVAQANVEGVPLMTADAAIAAYDVERIDA